MPGTIVFDLDGTLVDTAPDLVDTLNVVFASEGLPPVPYDQARNMVGGGMKAMIERGLRAEGRDCSPAARDKLFEHFLEHYTSHIADRSKPFPGLETALGELAARGYRLAVCTNKLEQPAKLLLDKLELSSRFAFVCGQETFRVAKPDAAILLRTIEAAGGDAKSSIMVGDSDTDIRTARAAGIPVVCVDFGYSDPPVNEFGPDRVISHFADLPAAIDAIWPNGAPS